MVSVCRYVYSLSSFCVSVSRCATSFTRFGGGSAGDCGSAAGGKSTDAKMLAMARIPGGFRAGLLAGWTLLCVIGIVYARSKGVPTWTALPVLAALLMEYTFYLVPAFPKVRESVAGRALPWYLVASAALPYLACCAGAIHFQVLSLLKLVALALVLGLWYRALPAHPAADFGFLALVAAVKLSRYATSVYPTPYRGVEIGILGDLALFHI